MKKLRNTVSHAGVIALALLALAIGTVVWLFERMRGKGKCETVLEQPSAARGAILEFPKGEMTAEDDQPSGPATGPQPAEAWEPGAASSD